MAHQHNNSAYGRLAERLNRFPQGAPATPLLFEILKMLFSEREAGLVAQLPIKPFSAKAAAGIWKKSETESRQVLDELAGRAILLDMEQNGEQVYCLPPPMAGFFEFAFMRVRKDLDQQALAELFEQYIFVEDDFMRALFVQGDTGLGRVFVQEPALEAANAARDDAARLEVLGYERASQVLENAKVMGVSLCYCRHKQAHLGKNCDAPLDICMTFDTPAASLIKHGHARAVDKAEGRALLQEAYAANLVQFGENVRQGVCFICNCCGCCCEALNAVKRFGIVQTIHSEFIIELAEQACLGCCRCVKLCPVGALRRPEPRPAGAKGGPPEVNRDICLGCGVCLRGCPARCLSLQRRPGRTITPLNTAHRLVLMAAERGTLQNLIFDNQVLFSHRLAAAVLGAVLKLPPVARSLARKQLKSRYVERLLENM